MTGTRPSKRLCIYLYFFLEVELFEKKMVGVFSGVRCDVSLIFVWGWRYLLPFILYKYIYCFIGFFVGIFFFTYFSVSNI